MRPDKQGAYAVALAFNLADEAKRPLLARRLVELIRQKDNHVDTGIMTMSHLNHALTDEGYADVAYTLLLQETAPSWLAQVNEGATTVWEMWDPSRQSHWVT